MGRTAIQKFERATEAKVIKSEKDRNGNIVLTNIEPQTGEPYADIDSLINALGFPPDSDDTIMRTDDKIFNEEYKEDVKNTS